jgi:hypothetical protein
MKCQEAICQSVLAVPSIILERCIIVIPYFYHGDRLIEWQQRTQDSGVNTLFFSLGLVISWFNVPNWAREEDSWFKFPKWAS